MQIVQDIPNLFGNGIDDDTAAIQAVLDSGVGRVYLPKPKVNYVISKTLIVHSGQHLDVDAYAHVKLKDWVMQPLLQNENCTTDEWDENIKITGGIWDGNNEFQTCDYHERLPMEFYKHERYMGVIFRFNKVKNLTIRDVTFKDPEMYGFCGAHLEYFTIENIYFDYNLKKGNMDGIHVHGPASYGLIRNLKGTTNDDLVALNADDGQGSEMGRGEITDIRVEGIFGHNVYTGVRLLSKGHKIARVHISGIFGSYRYYATSFTHHGVHPEGVSRFEDIVIENVFASKANYLPSEDEEVDGACIDRPVFFIEHDVEIKSLMVSHCIRREYLPNARKDLFLIEENAKIDALFLNGIVLDHETGGSLCMFSDTKGISQLEINQCYLGDNCTMR